MCQYEYKYCDAFCNHNDGGGGCTKYDRNLDRPRRRKGENSWLRCKECINAQIRKDKSCEKYNSEAPERMPRHYILDANNKPIYCKALLLWAEFMKKADVRTVAKTRIKEVEISTVFLGLDHNYLSPDGPPILYETMVFGGEHDQDMERYATREEAEAGHKRMVEKLKQ